MFLLDDLLFAPVHGFKFILEQIRDTVDKELNDETVIKQDLLELQMRLDQGEVSEEEFAEREAELFARLRAARGPQLEQMQQVHTASSSSFVVETRGTKEGDRG